MEWGPSLTLQLAHLARMGRCDHQFDVAACVGLCVRVCVRFVRACVRLGVGAAGPAEDRAGERREPDGTCEGGVGCGSVALTRCAAYKPAGCELPAGYDACEHCIGQTGKAEVEGRGGYDRDACVPI